MFCRPVDYVGLGLCRLVLISFSLRARFLYILIMSCKLYVANKYALIHFAFSLSPSFVAAPSRP